MPLPSKFFKNRRVYLLTVVAYMGSLLFGKFMFKALCLHRDLISPLGVQSPFLPY
jgi:hypothetical protein